MTPVYESGVTASYDSDVGTGWHHIAKI